MEKYDKLVDALRICHVVDCDDCVLKKECVESIIKGERPYVLLHNDAADAIEALQAEKKKTVTQIFGEEQQEWEEYCTGLMNRIKELKAQLPKRGEVVRCRECRWGHLCVMGQHLGLDGFCSKGEREVQE